MDSRPGVALLPWLAAVVVAIALFAVSCASDDVGQPDSVEPVEEVAVGSTGTPAPQCSTPITLDPTDPVFLGGDSSGLPIQGDVDCFAWQTFIALNWPVDPSWPASADAAGEPDRAATASTWGDPAAASGPYNLTTWESYTPAQNLFDPATFSDGESPNAWGVPAATPSACAGANLSASVEAPRTISAPNKFGPAAALPAVVSVAGDAMGANPSGTDEAAGGWLTDQAGKQVWFERLTNRAEHEYITDPAHRLWTIAGQRTVATTAPQGISLPTGVQPGDSVQTWDQLGAMELKAAWRVMTGLSAEETARFHLAEAYIVDPTSGACSVEVLGLVGLHIIHKTQSFPNFAWATFEHVDNVPSANHPAPPFGYSFNDPSCDATECPVNVARTSVPPPPVTEPVQVARSVAIPQEVQDLNAAVQAMIASANADSTFQYYELVNVLWPKSPAPPFTSQSGVPPLQAPSMTSAGPNSPVANTTMETYVQRLNCTGCHTGAHVAVAQADTAACAAKPVQEPCYASDYSFLFQTATVSE